MTTACCHQKSELRQNPATLISLYECLLTCSFNSKSLNSVIKFDVILLCKKLMFKAYNSINYLVNLKPPINSMKINRQTYT